MLYLYIVVIVIQLGVIIYFSRRGKREKNASKILMEAKMNGSYEEWRNLALQVSPQQLKLNISGGSLLVYGVVMDWNLQGSVMTLAAYVNGAANLYLNSGEVIKGGGLHPAVSAAAIEFVAKAQDKIGKCVPTDTILLPFEGFIRFSLLTNQGRFAGQEELEQIEQGNSMWMSLFSAGSKLMSEIRAHELETRGTVVM